MLHLQSALWWTMHILLMKIFSKSSGKTKPINMERFRKTWVVGGLTLISCTHNSLRRGV